MNARVKNFFKTLTSHLASLVTMGPPLASPGTTSVVRIEPSVVLTMCDRCVTRDRRPS